MTAPAVDISLIDTLTPRQMDVAELAAEGWSGTHIARTLCLDIRTVERHLGNIYKALGLKGPLSPNGDAEIHPRSRLSYLMAIRNSMGPQMELLKTLYIGRKKLIDATHRESIRDMMREVRERNDSTA